MKQQIFLVPPEELKVHEKTNKKRLLAIVADIRRCGVLNAPIVVARQAKVVLDGHHRLAALKLLGAKFIPVVLVDYFSKQIGVGLRRPKLRARLIKTAILSLAAKGKVLPYKTTRHELPQRLRNERISLSKLV